MFIKILTCFWLPIVLIAVSTINIVKPLKMRGALVIKGSRRNENTWNFTQRFYSVFLLALSVILLILAYIFLQKTLADEISLRNAHRYIGLLAIIFLLIPIPFTRLALSKKFDQEGNYKKN